MRRLEDTSCKKTRTVFGMGMYFADPNCNYLSRSAPTFLFCGVFHYLLSTSQGTVDGFESVSCPS